jgi:hypothetical protein
MKLWVPSHPDLSVADTHGEVEERAVNHTKVSIYVMIGYEFSDIKPYLWWNFS